MYALKKMSKSKLQSRGVLECAYTERLVLELAESPFIIKLFGSFQTAKCLYLVMEYAQGGELFYHFQRERHLSQSTVRFYAAEIVLALESLHLKNIVYGDLKPENILLSAEGHVLLSDFGLANFDSQSKSSQSTPEYMSPEQLRGETVSKSSDLWALVG